MDAANVKASMARIAPPAEAPRFLLREEPRVLVCYDSAGRLTLVKGDDCVCLSPDDLRELRRFVGRIAGLE